MTSALLSCAVPPHPESFEGSIMLSLAAGTSSVDEVRRAYTAMATELDAAQFVDYWPRSTPVDPADVDAIVDACAAEHRRVVTRVSDDALALMTALVAAGKEHLVVAFGDTLDEDDTLELVTQIRATEDVVAPGEFFGYVYADIPDVEEMVLTGRLAMGYGTFDDVDRPDEDAGNLFVGLLRDGGLVAHLDEQAGEIVVDDLTYEVPLED